MLLQAYLKADEKLLAQHCTPEAVERLTSIVKAEHALVIHLHPHLNPLFDESISGAA